MGLLAEGAANAQWSGTAKPCKFGDFLAGLDDDDRAWLEGWLDTHGVGVRLPAMITDATGVRMSHTTMYRHLKGGCSCGPDAYLFGRGK